MGMDEVCPRLLELVRALVCAATTTEHWKENFLAALSELAALLNVPLDDAADPVQAAEAVLDPEGLLAKLQHVHQGYLTRRLLFVRAASLCRLLCKAIREAQLSK